MAKFKGEIKEIFIGGGELVAVCNRKGTAEGFCHVVELWENGRFLCKARKNYFNRTWEAYPYESTIKKAVFSIFGENEKAEKIVAQFATA